MTSAAATGAAATGADDVPLRVVYLDDDEDCRVLVRLGLAAAADVDLVDECSLDDDAPGRVRAAAPDVVLIDVAGGRGMGMIPPVRAAAPDAQVLAVVGYGADDIHGALAHAGVAGQLMKRTRPTALAHEIRAMLLMLELVGRAVGAVDALTAQLEPDLTSGRRARTFVDAALQQWGCADLLETVTLLTSELVTNAVTHARSAPEIAIRLHPGCVRIEVHDSDPTIPKRRLAGPESPSGRGLQLVESLSRSWGVEPTPTGKYYWFEVDRPDQRPAGEHDGARA